MAGMLTTRGRRTLPLSEVAMLPEAIRIGIEGCNTADQMHEMLSRYIAGQTTDLTKMEPFLMLGACYKVALERGWVEVITNDMKKDAPRMEAIKQKNAAFETAARCKIPHMRTCYRLLNESLKVDNAIKFYWARKRQDELRISDGIVPLLPNTPRRVDGLDFWMTCLRMHARYLKVLGDTGGNEEEAVKAANNTLPRERVRDETVPTASQQNQRKEMLIVACMGTIAAVRDGAAIPPAVTTALDWWDKPADLLRSIAQSPYTATEQEQYEPLADAVRNENRLAAIYGSALRLLQYADDSWESGAIGDTDENEEGDDARPITVEAIRTPSPEARMTPAEEQLQRDQEGLGFPPLPAKEPAPPKKAAAERQAPPKRKAQGRPLE